VLASLLPGIRHLRAPLAAGYLWLVTGWILFHDRLDTAGERGASADAILALRDEASTAGLAIAISFVAYVAGSMSQALSSWLAESIIFVGGRIKRRGDPGTGRLSSRGARQLTSLVRREERAAEAVLRDNGFNDGEQMARWGQATEAPLIGSRRYFLRALQRDRGEERMAEHLLAGTLDGLVRNDLPLVHLRLAGAEATRELFSEIDRTKSEAELRLAIWLPLGALAVALGAREWGEQGLLLGAIVAVVVCSALIAQGIRRLRAANDSLVDVVRSRVAQLPTFELLREQANVADPKQF
jgi:hypothetical protein